MSKKLGEDANSYPDPGEDITVHPVLKNMGSQPATGITATLSTSTPGITINNATASYPDLSPGASSACNSPHFTFSVGTGVACGTVINFSMEITAAGGGDPWTQPFTMTVGNVVPGGTITDFSQNFTGGTPPALRQDGRKVTPAGMPGPRPLHITAAERTDFTTPTTARLQRTPTCTRRG